MSPSFYLFSFKHGITKSPGRAWLGVLSISLVRGHKAEAASITCSLQMKLHGDSVFRIKIPIEAQQVRQEPRQAQAAVSPT